MLNIVQLEPPHLPFFADLCLSGRGAAWVQYWLRTGSFLALHTSRDFGLPGILGKGVTKENKFNCSSLNI